MTRKKSSISPQALILAFAAGALAGSAGALTLRRRQQAEEAGLLGGDPTRRPAETPVPPTSGGSDGPPQGSMRRMPSAQHG
ncbi:hypothetical protein ACTMSW_08655 [Micromonospora sp. BQ11]|uniref:hypothetical protein n=1 Tax=Micromonospora sp. BQ11 TaxID=3452212 RepID=UPI003F8BFBA0